MWHSMGQEDYMFETTRSHIVLVLYIIYSSIIWCVIILTLTPETTLCKVYKTCYALSVWRSLID